MMEFDEVNLKIVLKGGIYSLPCNLAVTPDKDKLVIVIKQSRVGEINEIRRLIIADGKRLE